MRIRLGGALVGFAVAGGGSGLGAARGMPLRPGHHDASGAPAALPLSGRSGPPPAACAPWDHGPPGPGKGRGLAAKAPCSMRRGPGQGNRAPLLQRPPAAGQGLGFLSPPGLGR